jgi:hypothetical protein
MTINVPMSDVGLIAGILGVFFLLVAFYKSMFHRSKSPEEVALEAMEQQRLREQEESLKVKISDPYVALDPGPPSDPQPEVAPELESVKEADTAYSAFRQLNPAGVLESVSRSGSTTYEWE